jgi:hypothetical protein
MKELLKYIVENIVNEPKDVSINERKLELGEIVLELKVNPTDMGVVIGKGGKVIKSIRNLMRTKAILEHKKVNLVLREE